MRSAVIATLLSGVVAVIPAAVGAQDTRLVVGAALQRGIFGDDDPRAHSEYGPTIGVQVCPRRPGVAGFCFEALLEPNSVQNPHFDESLQQLHLQAGVRIGGRTYVRPSAGVAVQMWSGTMAESGLGLGIAAGAAIGRDVPIGRGIRLSPEIVARASFAWGVFTTSLGVQVPVAWGKRSRNVASPSQGHE
jgi:hypothetical protein